MQLAAHGGFGGGWIIALAESCIKAKMHIILQALINSTITANMNFTKTSPKFGQWSDHRANTVYGLGFSSERDLQQVQCAYLCC